MSNSIQEQFKFTLNAIEHAPRFLLFAACMSIILTAVAFLCDNIMTFLVNLGIPKYISAIFVAIFIFSCFCALYLIRLWIVEMLPSGKFLAMVPEIKKIIEEIERFFENGKEFDAILNADIDNLYYKFEQLKIPVKNIGNELTAYIFFLNVLSFAEGGRIKDARKLDMAKMIDEDENEKLKDIYKHVKNLRQKSKQK